MNTASLVRIGKVTAEDGEVLQILYGWNKCIARKLPVLSRQHSMLQHTPHDASHRFRDQQSAEVWHANPRKNPRIYVLCHEANEVCGVAWFSRQGHAAVPGATHTFAIRLYDGYRGRGLALPFAGMVHEDFSAHLTGGLIWLETDEDNVAAQAVYHHLGYKEISKAKDGRVVMAWATSLNSRTSQ